MNVEKSELDPKYVFGFVGYQFDLKFGRVRPRPVANPPPETTGTSFLTSLSSLVVHVLDRSANSHRKTSSPGLTTHETHRPILKQLKGTRITKKGDHYPQVSAPQSKMVAEGRQCTSRSTITPTKTSSANLYRCSH